MTRSFGDGYVGGWRSIWGAGAAIPTVPTDVAVPQGADAYEYGVARGAADAQQRKAEVLAEAKRKAESKDKNSN
jgi:hypothetical protein